MLHTLVALAIILMALYCLFIGGCTALAAILPDEREEEEMWAAMRIKRPRLWRWLGWMR